MKINLTNEISDKNSVIAIFIFEDFDENSLPNDYVKGFVKDRFSKKDFKGSANETLVSFIDFNGYPERIMLVGLGKSKEFSSETLRQASGKVVSVCRKQKWDNPSIYYFGWDKYKIDESTSDRKVHPGQVIAEGCHLANYNAKMFQSNKDRKEDEKPFQLTTINLMIPKNLEQNDYNNGLKKGSVLAECGNYVRDLINSPANIVKPYDMVERAREIAKHTAFKLTVLDKKELLQLNMGAILGVNQGSKDEPFMIIMDYNPENSKEKPITLVGKGITFDAGGLNIKTSDGMLKMKVDKSGGCNVLGVMKALSMLGIKKRVVGVVPVTENLLGYDAYKPGDVLTSYSGKTIEVLNTDAEGRLILCDALSYAVDKFDPAVIVDMATLTGAVGVALGNRIASVMGNDSTLIEQLLQSSKNTDERIWELPLPPDYCKKVEGTIADLRNISPEVKAGSIMGGAFLKEFVGDTKWAHIDLAYPVYFDKAELPYETEGATGFGIRLIVDFVENFI